MRKKRNLSSRLENCKDRLLIYSPDELDFSKRNCGDEIIDLQNIFGNSNPIELEIGCGKGGFIVELAKRNPNVNYIAVEKSENIIVLACEKAVTENVNNIFFISSYAEYLPRLLSRQSVSAIYLNFSCPFPKKSHAAHRLTNRRFLDIYKHLLVPCSKLFVKTDSMSLFEYSIEELSQSGFVLQNVSLDLHNSIFAAENIVTEYENKFIKTNKPIYRLEAQILDWK